jgi:large subunit ribosomal protein L29
MAGRKAKERADELRALNDEKLSGALSDAYRRLFTLRLQLTTRQQSSTSENGKARRQIARVRTIQRERELAAAFGQGTGKVAR